MLLSLYCLDFNKENVVWKDELKDNRNSYSGELPDGDYDPYGLSTTKIYYCCRSDGVAASDPIYLPTDLPFVLFKSGSHLCQKVEGMQVKANTSTGIVITRHSGMKSDSQIRNHQ